MEKYGGALNKPYSNTLQIHENRLKNLKEFVQKYLELGLTLIPLKRNSKVPKVEKWTTLSRKELCRLFEKLNAEDNLGIRVERPLFIVDVDDHRLLPIVLDEIKRYT
ncbi:MAG: hypothetical protein QXI58_08050, partial [Candidatus Micrarchaeia archaeon]